MAIRKMRNWWIEATIDGRETVLRGGPRAKEGGFELTIWQRDKGASIKVLDIRGSVLESGCLQVVVRDPYDVYGGNRKHTVTTER